MGVFLLRYEGWLGLPEMLGFVEDRTRVWATLDGAM